VVAALISAAGTPANIWPRRLLAMVVAADAAADMATAILAVEPADAVVAAMVVMCTETGSGHRKSTSYRRQSRSTAARITHGLLVRLRNHLRPQGMPRRGTEVDEVAFVRRVAGINIPCGS